MVEPKSIKEFAELLAQTSFYEGKVSVTERERKKFLGNLRLARKIYITGTGTSLPCAKLLTRLIDDLTDKAASFLPTGEIIHKIPNFHHDDLVILVSHGMNRADGLIIFNELTKRQHKIIVLSGNKDISKAKNVSLIIVPPEKEKIFCRPISPVTTFLTLTKLFDISVKSSDKERKQLIADFVHWVNPEKQTILLHSADTYIGAGLLGVVLREGAGLNLFVKEFENYAHGYYGVDTMDLENRQYLILTSSSVFDRKDFGRASRLYGMDGFNKFVLNINQESFYDINYTLFRLAPELVLGLIRRTHFDMNHPNGMDENRYYHEYERWKNYL
jgi:D-arabinose 5-phosphate isomerase GutQ